MERDNYRRAADAEMAICAYVKAQGKPLTDARVDVENVDVEEVGFDTALTDLLANLRHWARRVGVDYEQASRMALQHFEEEHDEQQGF